VRQMLNHKLGFTRVDFDHRMGFSLVEVLIALLITIISVVSLLNFLVTSLQVNYTSSAISEDLLDKSGNLEARTQAVQTSTATVTIDDKEFSGILYEVDYGKNKRLIEFSRSQ